MSHKMGWCLDGHHDECRTEFISWGGTGDYVRCGCACHPIVDESYIAEYVEANKVAGTVAPTTTRKRRSTVVEAPERKAPARLTKTQRKRNTKAEAEALAATEAALAAVEADESVRERMTELMEEA